MMSEVDDARGVSAVFVSIGKEPEEIARCSQAVLLQDFGTAGADALKKLNGGFGRDCHELIVGERSI